MSLMSAAAGTSGLAALMVLLGCGSSPRAGQANDAAIIDAGTSDAAADVDISDVQTATDGAVAGAIALATGQDHPTSLIVDSSQVYWLAAPGTPDSGVFAVPIAGGTPRQLANAAGEPIGIAVAGNAVYWTDQGNNAVMAVDISGGTPSTLEVGQYLPAGISAGAGGLYWANSQVMPGIYHAAFDGGAAVRLATAYSPAAVALSQDSVYWVNEGLNGEVVAVPLGGGTASTLSTNQSGARFGVAVDSAYAYWTTFQASGVVARVPLDAGAVDTIASGQAFPTAITIDGANAYWINYGTGSDAAVMSVPLAGGTPVTIAHTTLSQTRAYQVIVADGQYLYWTDYLGGKIMRAPKN